MESTAVAWAVAATAAAGLAVEARAAGNEEMYTRGSPHTRECTPKRTSCSTGWSGQSSTRRCRSPQAVRLAAAARVPAAVGWAAAARGLVAVVRATAAEGLVAEGSKAAAMAASVAKGGESGETGVGLFEARTGKSGSTWIRQHCRRQPQ